MKQPCPCLTGGKCCVPSDQLKLLVKEGRLERVGDQRIWTSGLFIKARHQRKVRRAIRRSAKKGADHVEFVSTLSWGPGLADGLGQEIAFYREVQS